MVVAIHSLVALPFEDDFVRKLEKSDSMVLEKSLGTAELEIVAYMQGRKIVGA